LLGEILRAKRSIRIVTFVVGNDATGIAILEALASRARDGVEVRLLLDDLLSFEAPHGALARFKAAGGRLERFMPLLHLPFRGQANLRNHRKIAVFDGERAIVGGTNLAGEYMGQAACDRWRDLSILLTGGLSRRSTPSSARLGIRFRRALAPLDATARRARFRSECAQRPDSASDRSMTLC